MRNANECSYVKNKTPQPTKQPSNHHHQKPMHRETSKTNQKPLHAQSFIEPVLVPSIDKYIIARTTVGPFKTHFTLKHQLQHRIKHIIESKHTIFQANRIFGFRLCFSFCLYVIQLTLCVISSQTTHRETQVPFCII